jgi:hypothetical protein
VTKEGEFIVTFCLTLFPVCSNLFSLRIRPNMTSAFITSHSSVALYIDAEVKCYMVRDTLGAGDCALLSLLVNPSLKAPVSSSNELRHAIVSFTRGAHREECFTAFSLVGDWVSLHFEMYLLHVLQPGVWVGTIFLYLDFFGVHL